MEQLVQNILNDPVVRGMMRPIPTSCPITQVTPKPPVAPQETVITSRLITMEVVRQHQNSGQRWLVPRGAVITPAAKDELKQRKIELAFEATADCSHTKTETPAVAPVKSSMLIAVHTPMLDGINARYLQSLSNIIPPYESFFESCIKATVKRMTEQLVPAEKQFGVIFTAWAGTAAILINRVRPFAGLVAIDPQQTQRELEVAKANVLIVNPRHWGQFQLGQLIKNWACRG